VGPRIVGNALRTEWGSLRYWGVVQLETESQTRQKEQQQSKTPEQPMFLSLWHKPPPPNLRTKNTHGNPCNQDCSKLLSLERVRACLSILVSPYQWNRPTVMSVSP